MKQNNSLTKNKPARNVLKEYPWKNFIKVKYKYTKKEKKRYKIHCNIHIYIYNIYNIYIYIYIRKDIKFTAWELNIHT